MLNTLIATHTHQCLHMNVSTFLFDSVPFLNSVDIFLYLMHRMLERSQDCDGMTFVDWDIFRGKKFLW